MLLVSIIRYDEFQRSQILDSLLCHFIQIAVRYHFQMFKRIAMELTQPRMRIREDKIPVVKSSCKHKAIWRQISLGWS